MKVYDRHRHTYTVNEKVSELKKMIRKKAKLN